MNRTVTISMALLSAALVACSGGQTNAPAKPAPKTGVAKLVDDLCACTTLDCIDKLQKGWHGATTMPQKVAIQACLAKARVHAAATMMETVIGFSKEMCACKVDTCRTQVEARFKEFSATGAGLDDQFVESVATIYQGQLDTAMKEFERCGGSSLTVFGSQEARRMTALADRMCRCASADCAQATHKAMMAWVKEHFKGGKRKGSKRNVELWKKAQRRFNKCYIERIKAGNPKPAAKKPEAKPTMTSFANRMCACRDAVCASEVHRDMIEWVKAHFKGGKKKGTKKNVEKWKSDQARFNKCYIENMKKTP